jgi:hypothetical protein
MGVQINANPNALVIPVTLVDAISVGSSLTGQAQAAAAASAASAALADADRIAAETARNAAQAAALESVAAALIFG